MKKFIIILILVGIFALPLCMKKEPKKEVIEMQIKEIKVSSPAFGHMQRIPKKYTCDGNDISPPLKFENIPENAESLAIIVDDPDAPIGTFTHWVAWNLDTAIVELEENARVDFEGVNDFGRLGYGGPCPPRGSEHRYFFKVYALDKKLELNKGASKEELEKAMKGHVIAKGELVGLYGR